MKYLKYNIKISKTEYWQGKEFMFNKHKNIAFSRIVNDSRTFYIIIWKEVVYVLFLFFKYCRKKFCLIDEAKN